MFCIGLYQDTEVLNEEKEVESQRASRSEVWKWRYQILLIVIAED